MAFNKIRNFLYRAIASTISKANQYTRAENFNAVATFDSTVILSLSANITNAQNDKAKIIIGKNTVVHGHLIVFGFGGEIEIGSDTFIGANSNVWSAKKIKIGNHVLVSHNVNIIDNISHPKNHLERERDWDHIRTVGFRTENNFDLKEKEVIIEDNVWLGFNSSVFRGVTIGKGAIIGANTVITKDVPAFAIMIGNPATQIGYAD